MFMKLQPVRVQLLVTPLRMIALNGKVGQCRIIGQSQDKDLLLFLDMCLVSVILILAIFRVISLQGVEKGSYLGDSRRVEIWFLVFVLQIL